MNNINKSEVKLKRNLSPLNVLALSFGSIIGWGAFVLPGDSFLPLAGPFGTLLGFLSALVLSVILVYNYAYMSNIHPKAGGEFIYAKECFGKKHAFACSWLLCLAYLSIIPLNASALSLLVRILSGDLLEFGFHYSVAGYQVYLGEIILSVSVLTLFAFLCYLGVKKSGNIQNILISLLIGGVIIMFFAVISSDLFTLDSYTPAFSLNRSKISGISSIVALTPWAFMGFQTIPQAVEEFNFSSYKVKNIMLLSIILGAVVYILLTYISISVIPSRYHNWYEYINELMNLKGLETIPVFYVSNKLLGNVGLFIIGVTILSAILSGIMGFYVATSRLLISMSNGNILPKWFGYLDPIHKTPKNAILFILVISIISSFGGRTALNWILSMASLGAAIGFIYTTSAALKISLRKEQNNIVFISALGLLISIFFLVLIFLSLQIESYICLLLWIIIGAFQYFRLKKLDTFKK